VPKPDPDHPTDPEIINPVVDKATYDSTLAEVRQIVEDLNTVVFTKDYARWTGYLTNNYLKKLGDPTWLREYMKKQNEKGYKLNLKTSEDYFRQVFVPSRWNLTADEIFFLRTDVVKVFMAGEKQKTVIYVLKKTGKDWKIEDPELYN
jgi:hypothetical protein